MKRLTFRTGMGDDLLDAIAFLNPDDAEGMYNLRDIGKHGSDELLLEIANRLAEYEDTGLEPKELNEKLNEAYDLGAQSVLRYKGLTWSEAEELLRYREAEEQGLLVRLPCKVGDTIWLTGWWDACKWVSKLSSPIERRIRYFSTESDGVYAHVKDGCINVKHFGEIVFLTKEAAEKALEDV
ncbi:MAG: hypothetical protein IKU32_02145 [Clostridia bacterium]|nr:hypothetical protein [Clostridia bacterium]